MARRAGNSPEVIHRRYHGCIDGHEEAATRELTRVFRKTVICRSFQFCPAVGLHHEVSQPDTGSLGDAIVPLCFAWSSYGRTGIISDMPMWKHLPNRYSAQSR